MKKALTLMLSLTLMFSMTACGNNDSKNEKKENEKTQTEQEKDKPSEDAEKQNAEGENAEKQDAEKQNAEGENAEKQDAEKQNAEGENAEKQDAEKQNAEGENTEKQDGEAKKDEKTEKDGDKEDKEKAEGEEEEPYPLLGKKPIDFSLPTLKDGKEGEIAKLADHLGKDPILITFFTSRWPHCVNEMPALTKIYKEYKDKGLVVYAIDPIYYDKLEQLTKTLKDQKADFPVLLCKEENKSIFEQYEIRGIPLNLFVGKDGLIKDAKYGSLKYEIFEESIKSIMK